MFKLVAGSSPDAEAGPKLSASDDAEATIADVQKSALSTVSDLMVATMVN
jgi:hypothetical protein